MATIFLSKKWKQLEEMAFKYLINPVQRFFSLIEKESRVLLNDKGAMIITYFIPIISIIILATLVPEQLVSNEGGGAKVGGLVGMDILKVGLIDLITVMDFPIEISQQSLLPNSKKKHKMASVSSLFPQINQNSKKCLDGGR